MGRLFWKILLGFWCAMLAASVGVGVLVSLYNESRLPAADELAGGYTTSLMTFAAAAALSSGGADALRATLDGWPRFARERLLAVDDAGRDILGRAVPATPLAQARRLAAQVAPGAGHAHVSSGVEPALPPARAGVEVRSVQAADGRHYLVFLSAREPLSFYRAAPFRRTALVRQLLLGGVAGLAFSAALAWYLTRPVRQLSQAFERAAGGDLKVRIGRQMGRRHDEISDLGHGFDRMAEQLEQLVQSQRQLLHDVSHELRSPLARLQVAVGLLRQQPDKAASSLARIEAESRRLDEMVGELLTLSRLEVDGQTASEEYFDMLELLDAVVGDARFEAERAGIGIELSADGEAIASGRAELMRRALDNVVRNAVKFSARGQVVEVRASQVGGPGWLTIQVRDRGPGVPDQDLDSIFKPFVQIARERSAQGFGLGLAIAQRALQVHRGAIQACNREGGGLIVEMRVPLASTLLHGH